VGVVRDGSEVYQVYYLLGLYEDVQGGGGGEGVRGGSNPGQCAVLYDRQNF